MSDVKLGVLCWNQYTDWPSLLAAGQLADRLGFDTLWTWDHLYPIVGSSDGPMFEGWLTLTAWAQATERIRIGLMVGANTFREPHADREDGHDTRPHLWRARDPRHRRGMVPGGARGVRDRVRSGPPERLRWLGEALPVMRGMLHGERPTASGPALHGQGRTQRSSTDPGAHAAAGRRRWRAGHAQAGGPLRRRQQRRWRGRERPAQGGRAVQHCETVGRDPAEIERTTNIGTVVIRDSRAEAEPDPGRDLRAERERQAVDRPAGRDARGCRRDAARRSSGSATATSSRASRRRTTRNR